MVKATATYKNRATGDRGGNASARIRFPVNPGGPLLALAEALWFRQAEAAMYHYIPIFRLPTSAHFIATLSVALTLTIANHARGAYSAKDFERCRADGGSIAACCRSAGGYLNQDATKCMASYLFRGPSQGDDGEKKPGVAPKFPTQTDSN